MESIKDRVAIVGMGCVKFGENWGQSLEDMIVDAAYEAFEDAGIGPEDIQAAWWGTRLRRPHRPDPGRAAQARATSR